MAAPGAYAPPASSRFHFPWHSDHQSFNPALAGVMELDGFYLDAHSGAVPPVVWELLDYTMSQCPNLGGVTFELFGSWFSEIGGEGVAAELSTGAGAEEILSQHAFQ